MVLPDDDPFKPALYQGLAEGFQVCGMLLDEILQLVDAGNLCVPGSSVNRAFFSLFPEFEDLVGNLIIGFFVIGLFKKLFLEHLQSFVNAISGILLSASDHLCNVLLELRLVGGLITKERVDCLNYHILQYRLIDGSCVAFLPGRLQPTDAAPDDGFAAAIVPVNSAEHFTTFATKDNLSKSVVAAVGALFASAGEDAVCFQTFCNPVHRVALQVFPVDAFYHLCLFRIDDEISICILGVVEEVIVIYLYLAILVA